MSLMRVDQSGPSSGPEPQRDCEIAIRYYRARKPIAHRERTVGRLWLASSQGARKRRGVPLLAPAHAATDQSHGLSELPARLPE